MFIDTRDSQKIVSQIADHVTDHCALISVGEDTEIDINELIEALNAKNIRFIGGIFPKIIHNNGIHNKGIVINTLKNVEALEVIENISIGKFKIPDIQFQSDESYSLVTYVDGLTSNISNYLNKLYENYGMKTNYFGGGAGSLTLKQRPCVFSKNGFFQDAAVVCVMRMKSNIGVKHGWKKLHGPLIVTKAEKNIIEEINWKTPFEIYKSVVETDANEKFNGENFFNIAKGYPFGIVKTDGECVIRDPLIVNEKGELVCVGEVEENTLVNIMKGNRESLISAAESAARESAKHADDAQKAIIIDCISRILFLEEDFDKELHKITSVLKNKYPNISVSGALTLGEISSYGNGYLEFYNKTCVVGLFE